MLSVEEYEQALQKINALNQTILHDFTIYLKHCHLSSKTIRSHDGNLGFFADYLSRYEPYKPLQTMNVLDINAFLESYFPMKAMWACPTNVNAYISTFKKFFKWQIATKTRDKKDYDELLETIRECKDSWIAAVSDDDDMGVW